MAERLYLGQVHGGMWGLNYLTDDSRICLSMRDRMMMWFNGRRVADPFFQSGFAADPHGYLLVEFWCSDQELILDECVEFAAHVGLHLDME